MTKRKRERIKAARFPWLVKSTHHFPSVEPPKLTYEQQKYREYLQSEHWKLFRLSIIAARGARCERCRSTLKIQVHHLTYERLGYESPADVRVLCEDCHRREHGRMPVSKSRTQQRDRPRAGGAWAQSGRPSVVQPAKESTISRDS